MKLRPAFKIHGGKFYLFQWIISKLPKNYPEMTYIEPFAGAASVLMNKEKSVEEVINDLDIGIIEIFRALRDEPKEFITRLKKLKYCQKQFDKVLDANSFTDYMDHAVNEFALRRMSRGGLKKAFAWSDRLRGGKPGDVNAWETALDLLPSISDRLQKVHIFNKNAQEIIKGFNGSNVLIYLDPPYLHETRVSKNSYSFEMTEDDHIKLAESLKSHLGKIIISGYPSALYNKLYKGWNTCAKSVPNNASQQKTRKIKTETLWMNF